MTKVHRAYNISYLQFFRWIYESFSTRGLFTLINEAMVKVKANPETEELFNLFNADTVAEEDGLFNKDPTCLERIPLFQAANIHNLYLRFKPEEQELFWTNVTSLCRYGGMLKTCGTKVETMESLAMDFVRDHPGLKPEEYHRRVFEDMTSNGDMSKTLLKTFKEPGTLKNILQNFGGLLRTPGEAPVDLSDLANMITPEDLENLDSKFAEMQEKIKESGVNPFDNVQELMRAGPPSSDVEQKGAIQSGNIFANMGLAGMGGNVANAVRMLKTKMAEAKAEAELAAEAKSEAISEPVTAEATNSSASVTVKSTTV